MADKGDEYIVERIVTCMFSEEKKRVLYEVKWKDYADTTEEPLEHFLSCPLIVLEFEKEQYRGLREIAQELEDAEFRQRGRRKQMLKRSFGKRNKDEYTPVGTEFVGKIYGTTYEGDIQMYHVKFYGTVGKMKVRLPYMEYYFPSDLLEFWERNPECIPLKVNEM